MTLQTLARFLPDTLQSNGITCRDETPASARELLRRGQLEAKDFIEQSVDIETTLMEAFIENDYKGKLHLMTLSMTTKKNNGDDDARNNDEDDDTDKHNLTNDEEIIGLSFWREVPAEEMGDWFDFERISNMITKSTTIVDDQDEHDNEFSIQAQSRMKLVRSSSITWIKNALASSAVNEADDMTNRNDSTLEKSIQKLTHSWVKIELIAIKQSHRAHHLGNILLGCTLAKAHTETSNDHAILHVAGGGASKNVPAAKLYKRYGFVAIPRHNEGGPFTRPDRDLFVLGNIGKALDDLPLEETLQVIK